MEYLDFPTGVGVNRSSTMTKRAGRRFPHGRGGEPLAAIDALIDAIDFPTGVGVNRPRRPSTSRNPRFPHGRGGEPQGVNDG